MTSDESDTSVLTDGAIPVTALIMLAGRLSGDAELGGDSRPSDAEFDGVVDQRREFRLCLLLCNAGALHPLQYLRWMSPATIMGPL